MAAIPNLNPLVTGEEQSDSEIEVIGPYTISRAALYLADVQRWTPRVTISRNDGAAQDFVVPCGPECYRKDRSEALMAGWATARQWLGGGRILWHAKLSPADPIQ